MRYDSEDIKSLRERGKLQNLLPEMNSRQVELYNLFNQVNRERDYGSEGQPLTLKRRLIKETLLDVAFTDCNEKINQMQILDNHYLEIWMQIRKEHLNSKNT